MLVKCLACRACYSQGRTIDELMINMPRGHRTLFEESADLDNLSEFVGVQRVTV